MFISLVCEHSLLLHAFTVSASLTHIFRGTTWDVTSIKVSQSTHTGKIHASCQLRMAPASTLANEYLNKCCNHLAFRRPSNVCDALNAGILGIHFSGHAHLDHPGSRISTYSFNLGVYWLKHGLCINIGPTTRHKTRTQTEIPVWEQ